MLLDLFLRERARGRWPVSEAVRRFHELAGPSFYRRIDVHFDRPTYEAVKQRVLVGLREAPPASLAGQAIVRTQVLSTNDGFKWFLPDGSWLLVRASGTEPLVRVYTEATTPALRDELVTIGERLVRGG
jgi:phosphomannomutase